MTKDLLRSKIIAPMATAVWLIDNTSLSFKQIGDFCDFTEAEVNLIADGVIGKGILPADPTKNGNLTKEEIFKCEQDGSDLRNAFNSLDGLNVDIAKQKHYIPMLQRRSRPDAVLWLVNYCPDLSDAQIIKLVRTTKNMVQMIRNRSYADYNNLVAKDPVILGFCSQRDLDKAVATAKAKMEKMEENEKKQAKKKAEKVVRKINVNKVKVENKENKIKNEVKKTTKQTKTNGREKNGIANNAEKKQNKKIIDVAKKKTSAKKVIKGKRTK